MIARIGPPDMKSGGSGRKIARWTYLPAPAIRSTITTLSFRGRTVIEVERKVVQVTCGRCAARARGAASRVDGRVTGAIGPGCWCSPASATAIRRDDRDWLARKIVQLRIFDDDAGVMNRSVLDTRRRDSRRSPVHALRVDAQGQPAVVVGRRAAARSRSRRFDAFVAALAQRARQARSPTGVFGAHMQVALVNDGPVTIWLDSRARE